MKRYYMVHDRDMPTIKEDWGNIGWIDLESHGPAGFNWNLFMLDNPLAQPKANWIPLPSLLDSKTTLAMSAVPHEALVDVGLTGEETTIEAVTILTGIHPGLAIV